ncbi:unnamed protein product [Heligmosomoides polygyrus]|uniref:RRM domain-containing protein n=1 Tax=Heligmosomoides polygyrus TaxID=6339 RepID=A0A183FFS5_HELPZ|nr:unnamed protein product [Heligmosomoides polygyrus]
MLLQQGKNAALSCLSQRQLRAFLSILIHYVSPTSAVNMGGPLRKERNNLKKGPGRGSQQEETSRGSMVKTRKWARGWGQEADEVRFSGSQDDFSARDLSILSFVYRRPITDLVTQSVCSVYFRNLPYQCTEKDNGHHFKRAGQVTNVKVVYDRETGCARSFGFVDC